ncbi:MAG: CotH kinase family protein [Verrucomicrobia bacterium]|nr:CotH kinase family protein [Verrucomicrobiota bacterium]
MYPLREAKRIWLALAGLLTLVVGSQAAEPTTVDPFAPDHVLDISITLPAAEWERMRNQARDPALEFSKDRLEHTAERPYSWFEGEVTIDGVRFAKVGVRKRGFFGSSSKDRPALNIDLAHFKKKNQFGGVKRLKLHNNQQDPSQVRQALAYQVFTAAGVPAPRCNFARVKINGHDLGTYSHIDRIDDEFLDRHFDNHKGNLYEAALSDFRPGWIETFQKKNENGQASRAELTAVAEALQSKDAELLEKLGRALDVDAFINFWAVESLINHWDGFAGHQNNTFIYHDPKSGKLRFIPWGPDATFGSTHSFVPFQPPALVLAVSTLTRRLYNHPETQERYRRRMKELLTTVWNEKKLQAEVDRMENLLRGSVSLPEPMVKRSLAGVRKFIASRRSAIEAELAQPAQAWNYPLRRAVVFEDVAKAKVSFSTTWTTNFFRPPGNYGTAQVELDFYGRHYSGTFTELRAGPDMRTPGNASVVLTGSFTGVSVPIHLAISTPAKLFRSGTQAFKPNETGVTLLAGHFEQDDFRLLAFSSTGNLNLKQTGMAEGAPVAGEFEGNLGMLPWEDFDLKVLKSAIAEKK